MSFVKVRSRNRTMRRFFLSSLWVAALAIIVAAIVLDRIWTSHDRHGPPVFLVIALLVLLSLLVPEVRSSLRRVEGVKVGVVEVTLTVIADATPDLIGQVRVVVEEGDDPAASPRVPRVITSTSAKFAEVSLVELSSTLTCRINWIWKQLASPAQLGRRPRSDADAVKRLRAALLLPSVEAAILDVVALLDLDGVARARTRDPAGLERFLLEADAVVHSARLRAFDAYVRSVFREEDYVIADWQQPQRWPDFLAYPRASGRPSTGSAAAVGANAESMFWVSVRMAEDKNSSLFKTTVDRLSDNGRRAEAPSGAQAVALIVVPTSSDTQLANAFGIKAIRLEELRSKARMPRAS